MRLREIQSELKESNVSYADCFDRESLVKRLGEVRDGSISPSVCSPTNDNDAKASPSSACEPTPAATCEPTTCETTCEPTPSTCETKSTETPSVSTVRTVDPSTATAAPVDEFDEASTLAELRSLRVRELKIKLSEHKVRWGTMIEKEEMVRALCRAMQERFEQGKNFSRSGALIPGMVTDVEDGTLIQELGWLDSDVNRGVATAATEGDSGEGNLSHPPLLLDVYATWCGPCQFLAPLLVEAAEELGPAVRVVKLDSDKYPRLSSVLKVGGLPTLIRFDGGTVSTEVQRVEGALTKEQIIDFVNGNFNR